MVNDVKGVLDEIRAILDQVTFTPSQSMVCRSTLMLSPLPLILQVPKMPEMPVMPETIYDQFNITDYIPGMSSPREDPPQPPVIIAPQNAQVYPEKDQNNSALNSTIASNAKGECTTIDLPSLSLNPNLILT